MTSSTTTRRGTQWNALISRAMGPSDGRALSSPIAGSPLVRREGKDDDDPNWRESFRDLDRRVERECAELRRRFEANDVCRHEEVARMMGECEREGDVRRRVAVALHLANTARFLTVEESLTNAFVRYSAEDRLEFVKLLLEHPMSERVLSQLLRNLNNPLTRLVLTTARGLKMAFEVISPTTIDAKDKTCVREEGVEEKLLSVLGVHVSGTTIPTQGELEKTVYTTHVIPFLESSNDLHYRFLSRSLTSLTIDDAPNLQRLYAVVPLSTTFESTVSKLVSEAFKLSHGTTTRLNAVLTNVVQPRYFASLHSTTGDEARKKREREFVSVINKHFIQSRTPRELVMLISAFQESLARDSRTVARWKSRALQIHLPSALKDMKVRIDYSNAVRAASEEEEDDENEQGENAERGGGKRARIGEIVQGLAEEMNDDEMVRPMIAKLCELLEALGRGTAPPDEAGGVKRRLADEEEARRTMKSIVALSGTEALVSSASLRAALVTYLIGTSAMMRTREGEEVKEGDVRTILPREVASSLLREEMNRPEFPTSRHLLCFVTPSLPPMEAMRIMVMESSTSLEATIAASKAVLELIERMENAREGIPIATEQHEKKNATGDNIGVSSSSPWFPIRWLRGRLEVMVGASHLEASGEAEEEEYCKARRRAMNLMDELDGVGTFGASSATAPSISVNDFLSSELRRWKTRSENDVNGATMMNVTERSKHEWRTNKRAWIRKQTWLLRVLRERYGAGEGRTGEAIARWILMEVLRATYSSSRMRREGSSSFVSWEMDMASATGLMSQCARMTQSTSSDSSSHTNAVRRGSEMDWFLFTWEAFLKEEREGLADSLALVSRRIEEELYAMMTANIAPSIAISTEWSRRLGLDCI